MKEWQTAWNIDFCSILKKSKAYPRDFGRGRFVCLYVWAFSSQSRIYHSYGDVTIAGEGLQILTCAWHSWSLSNEGSLACHGASVYNGHLRVPMTLTSIAELLTVELSLPVFTIEVWKKVEKNCVRKTLTLSMKKLDFF